MVLDYIEYDQSYCHYLYPRRNHLRKMVYNKDITLEDYRRIVSGIIKPSKWTKKKCEFIKNINNINTKQEIYYYISNSIKKSLETIVLVK